MKFKNVAQVEDFLAAVNACSGEVWLESAYGDKFNLKSKLTQYVAMGALLGEHGDELELFAAEKEDESRLMAFLVEHPEL